MTVGDRASAFCARFGLRVPILMAPMASASPPALAAAVANAGGMGGLGALLHDAAGIAGWHDAFRAASNGAAQINLWVPDPPPPRDTAREEAARAAMAAWGPLPPPLGDGPWLRDFDAQCEGVLAAAPAVASSIMGLFPPAFVARLKARGIAWFACVTTVADARAAEAAGADAVVAQGIEAGGHRGAFDAARAEAQGSGLFVLLPLVADAVSVPVIATGGIRWAPLSCAARRPASRRPGRMRSAVRRRRTRWRRAPSADGWDAGSQTISRGARRPPCPIRCSA